MRTTTMARHCLLLAAVATVVVVAQLVPRAAGYPWPVCGSSKSFKPNGKYQAYLNLAAATLPRNASTSPDLYAAAVIGSVPEQLWATGLCRGDINASDCFSCLTQAFQDLENDCSYVEDATIYYDTCSLHYSNVRAVPQGDTGTISYNANVTSDPAGFNRLVAALMNATADYAAYNSTRRFATGEAADFLDQEFPKVYSLAQCTPDQTPAQCRKCLAGVLATDLGTFQNSIRGRMLGVNCTYRYDTSLFFHGPAMVRIASPSSVAPAPAVQPRPPPTAARGGELKCVFVLFVCFSLNTCGGCDGLWKLVQCTQCEGD